MPKVIYQCKECLGEDDDIEDACIATAEFDYQAIESPPEQCPYGLNNFKWVKVYDSDFEVINE